MSSDERVKSKSSLMDWGSLTVNERLSCRWSTMDGCGRKDSLFSSRSSHVSSSIGTCAGLLTAASVSRTYGSSPVARPWFVSIDRAVSSAEVLNILANLCCMSAMFWMHSYSLFPSDFSTASNLPMASFCSSERRSWDSFNLRSSSCMLRVFSAVRIRITLSRRSTSWYACMRCSCSTLTSSMSTRIFLSVTSNTSCLKCFKKLSSNIFLRSRCDLQNVSITGLPRSVCL
mmetsp:Transcript_12056/g.36745  ORF Transcript_12056/g.36745 Transcript_12056/m.36745 type:complete len:230 (-) Transcript_12056:272-961(-)